MKVKLITAIWIANCNQILYGKCPFMKWHLVRKFKKRNYQQAVYVNGGCIVQHNWPNAGWELRESSERFVNILKDLSLIAKFSIKN